MLTKPRVLVFAKAVLASTAVMLKPGKPHRYEGKPSLRFRLFRLLLMAAFVSATLTPFLSQATVYTVTNNYDSGAGSLRYLINAASSGDTITFAPGLASPIDLSTSGEIAINKDLTIAGPGARNLTISGNNLSRVFNNISASTKIGGVTISGGSATDGGAILNSGNLDLDNVTLSGNSATDKGGAIHNYGSLALYGSTLAGNSATNAGGAIFNESGKTLIIDNSTISNNSASQGGAIANLGALDSYNATITGNTSSSSAAIDSAGTSLTLKNSIIAGNYGKDLAGTPNSARNNLIEYQILGSLGSDASGNISSIAPLLAPLANNGGPTDTYVPQPGSPVLNAGEMASCTITDQRGVTRMRQGGCDIGAVELASPLLLNAAGSQLSTIAGLANSPNFVDDPTGTSARFNFPDGITTDGTNLFIADRGNNRIRKIVIATGAVTTLAGSGTAGADDGAAAAAGFSSPYGIVAAGSTAYVADTNNNSIRQIDIATGNVSTLAGTGATSSVDGTCGNATFNGPAGLALAQGALYVSEPGSHLIRKIMLRNCGAPNAVSTLAGSSSGYLDDVGAAARFNTPAGLATDATTLYVADSGNNRIRTIDLLSGKVDTLAGSSATGGTDGIGASAQFSSPYMLVLDQEQLYVTDNGAHTIRRIDLAGKQVTTIAGNYNAQGSANGSGADARFNNPAGIVHDGKSLFITDSSNHTIRKIDPDTTTISAPRLANLNPGSGAQGQTLDVAVGGENTHFVNGSTTADFGPYIWINSVTVTDPTYAIVNVTVRPWRASGRTP